MNPLIYRPDKLPEICKTFGYLSDYINDNNELKKEWESNLKYIELPFPIRLDFDRNKTVYKVRFHRLVAPFFEMAISKIYEKDMEALIKTWGGSFYFRKNRNSSSKYSTHCWGISFDLNCFENQNGTKGNMPTELIDIFEDYGFYWGGHFKETPDPMHFQFCTGY